MWAIAEADAGTSAKSAKTGVRDASLVVQLRELRLDRRLRLRLRLRLRGVRLRWVREVRLRFERFEGLLWMFLQVKRMVM